MKIKVYLTPESTIDPDRLRWTLLVVLPIVFSYEDSEDYVFGHGLEDIGLEFTMQPAGTDFPQPENSVRIDVSVYSDWQAVDFVERTMMAQNALMVLFLGEDFDLRIEPLSPKVSHDRDEAAVERLRRRVDDTVEHIDDRITQARESQTTLLQELSS